MFVEVNEMMEEKQKGPLYYLQQPKLQRPKAKMQEFFSSKKAELEKRNEEGKPAAEKIMTKESERINEFTEKKQTELKGDALTKRENQIKVNETQQEGKNNPVSFGFQIKNKNKPSFQRVKSFKEMNTTERLDYLIDFPKQLPPVPCIFETQENTLQGFLISKTNEQIEIKQLDGSIEKVQLEVLKDVRMAGLRK